LLLDNRSGDGTLVLPSEYVEIVIERTGRLRRESLGRTGLLKADRHAGSGRPPEGGPTRRLWPTPSSFLEAKASGLTGVDLACFWLNAMGVSVIAI
jgi:hypothetical protein